MLSRFGSLVLGCVCAAAFSTCAQAQNFNISGGDLATALDVYIAQTGVQLIVSEDAVKGVRTNGVKGDLSASDALIQLLAGTGFATHREDGAIGIIRGTPQSELATPLVLAQAARPTIETVTVTSSKLGGADVQSIPISITALSQEQLTATQTAGGPDLVKQVPNLTFTKTNFTGYSINIRGIGIRGIDTGDFGHHRSSRCCCAQRHSVHSQSFFRAGILRSQPSRSFTRAAGHALWPQRDGRCR